MSNELKIQLTSTYSEATVVADIKNDIGTVLDSISLVDRGNYFFSGSVDTLDAGEYAVVFKADGVVVGAGELFWDGANEISIQDIVTIKRALLNNMKVIDDQLIIYEDDGTTPAYTFNLYDVDGIPTSTNVSEIENA